MTFERQPACQQPLRRPYTSRAVDTLVFGLFLLSIGSPVQSALIDFQFSAPITSVYPQLRNFFSVGDEITLSYKLNTDAPTNGPPTETRANYVHTDPPGFFNVSVALSDGSSYTATAKTYFIDVFNDRDYFILPNGAIVVDRMWIGSQRQDPNIFDFSGSSVNGLPPIVASLAFQDNSAAALNSLALPVSYDPSEWESAILSVSFGDRANPQFIVADLKAVPIPGAISLFGTAVGLIGIFGLRFTD